MARAVALRARDGSPGGTAPRLLAQGDGWSVSDVLCTYGPRDRPLDECHAAISIAVVGAGAFQYRSGSRAALMTPGSILLGSPGQGYACSHEHGAGDRCVLFQFAPGMFAELATAAGVAPGRPARFEPLRLPPLPALAEVVARACAGAIDRCAPAGDIPWEELALALASRVLRAAAGLPPDNSAPAPSDAARVARVARRIENDLEGDLSLRSLAAEAGLSRFHFLRTFERLTGLTPHQFVRRARLREAVVRLASEPGRVLDVAYDSGFGDLSNFNHAFRAEFGRSPRSFR